jgi:hypothetical protein
MKKHLKKINLIFFKYKTIKKINKLRSYDKQPRYIVKVRMSGINWVDHV